MIELLGRQYYSHCAGHKWSREVAFIYRSEEADIQVKIYRIREGAFDRLGLVRCLSSNHVYIVLPKMKPICLQWLSIEVQRGILKNFLEKTTLGVSIFNGEKEAEKIMLDLTSPQTDVDELQ